MPVGVVAELAISATDSAVAIFGTDKPCRARSDIGKPSAAIRFSTRHFNEQRLGALILESSSGKLDAYERFESRHRILGKTLWCRER